MSVSGFNPVCAAADLVEGRLMVAEVEGRRIVVCHGDKGFYALDDLCTHNGASFDGGKIKKHTIACPMHGARFDLQTGECLAKALGCPPIVTHRTRVTDGQVEVALSDRPVQQPTS